MQGKEQGKVKTRLRRTGKGAKKDENRKRCREGEQVKVQGGRRRTGRCARKENRNSAGKAEEKRKGYRGGREEGGDQGKVQKRKN